MITTAILSANQYSRDQAVVQFQQHYFLHNKYIQLKHRFFFMENNSFFAALKFVIDLMP